MPRRPAWQLSVAVDCALAVAADLASYWLRFQDYRFELFLPGARSTLPLVVTAQLLALIVAGAYRPRPRNDWLSRVFIGVVIGTIAAAALVGLTFGFEGVSRMAFAADGILLVIGAVAWRAAWVVAMRMRGRDSAPAGELVDRTAVALTFGATITSLYRYRELLRNLVIKDLKLKYRGSVLGFLWSLANPLLMIVVYTVAFTYIIRVRTEGFVFYLMLGLLAWTFFANAAMMSTGAIIDNAGLLKSVLFPRAILPISSVLFNLAQYVLTMLVFLPLMILWYRTPLAAPMLLYPVFLGLQVLFTIGIALMLATATVFFRDVRHFLEVALAAVFWTTPIVYELGLVPERLRLLILMSPMASFVVAYQKIFYYHQWPEQTVWVVACTYSVGAFLIGAGLMLAFEDRFSEQI